MINWIFEVMILPILILNLCGGVISGIWLAFLGEWKLLLIGVVLLFTSHIYLSILMLPGFIFVPIYAWLYERKNPLSYVFAFLSQFYTNLLIVGTCAFAFVTCFRFYKGESNTELIPYLLWSWGMALGPWQFFQSKERDNEFSAMSLFTASVLYFIFLISILIGPPFPLVAIALFLGIQLIGMPIFNLYMVSKINR